MASNEPQQAVLLASPDDAEAAFYEAMQQGDLEKMRHIWADEEDIACVHPGGVRMIGPNAVYTSFESLFANGPVDVIAHHVRRQLLGTVAIHHVVERVRVNADDEDPYGYVLATNVFYQTPEGWRMVLHHTSPGQGGQVREVMDTPFSSTLH